MIFWLSIFNNSKYCSYVSMPKVREVRLDGTEISSVGSFVYDPNGGLWQSPLNTKVRLNFS